MYAIYGHTIGSDQESIEFYGMRKPNDLDIYSKYYSPGQSSEYKQHVNLYSAQELESMDRGQFVKTQNGVNIHVTRPLNYIVLTINYMGKTYTFNVLTIDELNSLYTQYENNNELVNKKYRKINKQRLSNIEKSINTEISKNGKKLGTGITPQKKNPRENRQKLPPPKRRKKPTLPTIPNSSNTNTNNTNTNNTNTNKKKNNTTTRQLIF